MRYPGIIKREANNFQSNISKQHDDITMTYENIIMNRFKQKMNMPIQIIHKNDNKQQLYDQNH